MNPTANPNHRCRTSAGVVITAAVVAGFLGFMIGNGIGGSRHASIYDGSVMTAPSGQVSNGMTPTPATAGSAERQ